ncbi:hypothetical protein [Paenibacillus methanolicus]|uniref:Uncharacterized protein n=1 Tax=Paenibacillus methanolicus TaxID=582686 RepID=A0A5S5CFP0_9BACL|nr:hypothetical protein [Paenibacillus methanolicus]TYP77508.1 hypothetical protein BCM02_10268 [Paenibacillus methanolicus]
MRRRLIKQPFTHAKQRYLLTLDTDGMKLYLRCYQGLSENNPEVPLKEESLWDKVFDLISNLEGSDLAVNALRTPDRILRRVRELCKIPYPPILEWDALIEQLQRSGSVTYEGDLEGLITYLEYRQLPVIHFAHRGERTIVDASPGSNHVRQVLDELKNEMDELDSKMKALKALHTDIFERKRRLDRQGGVRADW